MCPTWVEVYSLIDWNRPHRSHVRPRPLHSWLDHRADGCRGRAIRFSGLAPIKLTVLMGAAAKGDEVPPHFAPQFGEQHGNGLTGDSEGAWDVR